MSMTLSAARANLPRLIDRVQAGEEVTITRHGIPVAVLVRPDVLSGNRVSEATRAARELRQRMIELRQRPLNSIDGLSAEFADELVAEVRAGREAR